MGSQKTIYVIYNAFRAQAGFWLKQSASHPEETYQKFR